MPLNLIYITNRPEIARIAESNGVQRIMVDLEVMGKEARQNQMNTVKSNHSVADVAAIAKTLTKSELLVRINPWHAHSVEEIEEVIASGAGSIMLPMWKTPEEVDLFLKTVDGRVGTTLLLETKEAVACLDEVLEHPLLEGLHIGLNDLHLSYGLTFMFEPLVNGVVEDICRKSKAKGVRYGIGGIAKLQAGLVPAACIIMEHYRLGSTAAILSRSFCDTEKIGDPQLVGQIFSEELARIRAFEQGLSMKTAADYESNRETLAACVQKAAEEIRRKRMQKT